MSTATLTRASQKKAESRSQHQGGNPRSSSATPSTSITQESENAAQNKHTAEEVPSKKRSNFTMLPNNIIDADISESCFTGFVRFLRHFGRAGVFTGSERKLSKILKLARQTVKKIIDQWVKAGWIIRTVRPKPYEDGGEVMCLILCDLWQSGTNVSQPGEEMTEGESPDTGSNNVDEPEKGDEDTGSNVDQGGTNVYHPGKEVDQPGVLLGQSGTSDTLKVGGNIDSKMDSNTDSKKGGNIGQPKPKERNTGPLPSLPPSVFSDKSFSFEDLSPDIPHCWEVIEAIGAHYLGTKVTQADAEALVQKTQSYASLAGAESARRQMVGVITFMLYSDHPANWFRNKPNQVTLRNIVTFWDDYCRKVLTTGWIPPSDKVPPWFFAQEQALSPAMDTGETEEIAMSRSEAEELVSVIQTQYPAIECSIDTICDDRAIVSLPLSANGVWRHTRKLTLWKPRDWYEPDEKLRAKLEQAIAEVVS